MIPYSNTKLNRTYNRFHKYGSDRIYRRRFTKMLGSTIYVMGQYHRLIIANSNLGMNQQIKTTTGDHGFYYTRLHGNNGISYSSN